MSAAEILEARYAQLERRMPVIFSPQYGPLVVPNGNHDLPLHRWFHLKEAYSTSLPPQILNETHMSSRKHLSILDPYAGVGTTCVSIAECVTSRRIRQATVFGVETNGFLHLVAATKLACLQQRRSNFSMFAKKIAKTALATREPAPPAPALTTFHTARYFDSCDLDQLMRLKCAIDTAEAEGADSLDVALARVCLGAIVEVVGNLRRDGRALRYTEKRSRPTTMEAFRAKATHIASDLLVASAGIDGEVVRGDGRLLACIDDALRFDLVLFSPPYPNNIDYTEVYKLENWLLGYITDAQSFVDQRLQTVYSHPSVLRQDPLPSALLTASEDRALREAIALMHGAVADDRYAEGRRRMLSGYALDMYITLRSARRRVKRGGWVVYVVGNSVHGGGEDRLIIAADLLIAELAEVAGLTVHRVAVARHLRRRVVSSPFVRESVVFLRRP